MTTSSKLVQDRQRIGTLSDYAAVQRHGVKRPGGNRTAANLAYLADLHQRGRLQYPIHLAVPLSEAAEAHRAVESGHVRGKVVLVTG